MKRGWTRFLCGLTALCFALALLPVRSEAAGNGKALQEGTAPIEAGMHVYFGVVPNGNEYTGGAGRPIEWRVLDVDGSKGLSVSGSGRALMISFNVLGVEKTMRSNNWAASGPKEWCTALYENFGAEKAAVAATSVVETNDKVSGGTRYHYVSSNNILFGAASLDGEYFFCLSAEEADKFFSNNTNRIPYSKLTWWLRSPGFIGSTLGFVTSRGELAANSGSNCIRPAFNLDLSAVLFTSPASGGKDSGSGASALTTVSSYNGVEWQMTLKDDGTVSGLSGHAGFDASCVSVDGDVWTIEYSGAQTGDNEYISAVVKDTGGNITYYGRIGLAESGTKTFTLDVGGKKGDSDALYVFNEQYNGAYKTDFASELKKITEPAETPTEYSVTVKTDGNGSAIASANTGAEGTTVTLSAYPNKNYKFSRWEIESGTGIGASIANANSANATLTIGTSDVTVKAYFEKEDEPTPASYSVTKGAGATWEKGSGKPMEYEVTRTPDNDKAYGLFQKFQRNGSDVPASAYTASSGSLKLSLNASYLETLSEGAHTLRFQFEDGYAETRLTIKAPANAPKEVPKTGDTNRLGLWMLMGTVALIGAWAAVRGLKRMKRE